MPFSPIGKFLPQLSKRPLMEQAAAALALEAGAAFIASSNAALFARIRLVSVKKGMLHALASSAPARVELLALKESLFSAIKEAVDIPLFELKVEIRGTLVDEQ